MYAVPSFQVSIDPQGQNLRHVGFNYSYRCRLRFSVGLLSDLNVGVEISDPSGTPIDSTGDRVMVSETTMTGNDFARTLHFSPLSAEDTGEYTCTATVRPVTPNPLVINSIESASQILIVIGK